MQARRVLSIAVAIVILGAIPAAAAPGWSIIANPTPVGAHQYLDGISCTGPATAFRCFAVGSYINGQGKVATLIEQWNGAQWRVVPSPNRAGAVANSLVAIACASATSCFAVGNSQATATSPAVTLIERWNGLVWTIVPSANVPNARGNFLHAVSCAGPGKCFAVGDYNSPGTAGSTLIERWNGSAWVIAPSPNKPGQPISTLEGVSCVPAGAGVSCFAVGNYATKTTGAVFFTLIERLGPGGWTIVPSPNVGGKYKSALNSVSCTSPSSCVAVGAWQHAPGAGLSETWNGRAWTIVGVANFPGWTFSQLNSVSCATARHCFAVGSWASGSPNKTLVVRWNGTGWTPVTSPNPTGSFGSTLGGVSCVGAKCLSVGSALEPPSGTSVPLTERNY